MNGVDNSPEDLTAIYVDLGTTNTRVWLLRGREILAQASKQVGVRNSAREGNTATIQSALKELIERVQEEAERNSESGAPVCVVAAGMIGSPLGLAEIPHIRAPAGLRELSTALCPHVFPEITTLPFLIVPGVCSGTLADASPHHAIDVMRGEETLCIGLHALGLVEAATIVLTLGSHWKAIRLSENGQIQSSVTSLSGELIDAVRSQTIIASSVADDWPDKLAPEWLAAGMQEQRDSGLSRALFCVRMLELNNEGTQSDRLAYLIGAFIAADLDALINRGLLAGDIAVVISGHTAIAEAWSFALEQVSVRSSRLTAPETEDAFLAGLKRILIGALSTNESAKAQP